MNLTEETEVEFSEVNTADVISEKKVEDNRRIAIALVTLYRSGSTFVGELFNQNLGFY